MKKHFLSLVLLTPEVIKMATVAGKILGVELNIQPLPKNTDKVELVNYETAIQDPDARFVLVDYQKFKLSNSHRFEDKIMIDTIGGWGDYVVSSSINRS